LNGVSKNYKRFAKKTGKALTSVFGQREKVIVRQRRPGGIVAFDLQLVLCGGHQPGYREFPLVPQVFSG